MSKLKKLKRYLISSEKISCNKLKRFYTLDKKSEGHFDIEFANKVLENPETPPILILLTIDIISGRINEDPSGDRKYKNHTIEYLRNNAISRLAASDVKIFMKSPDLYKYIRVCSLTDIIKVLSLIHDPIDCWEKICDYVEYSTSDIIKAIVECKTGFKKLCVSQTNVLPMKIPVKTFLIESTILERYDYIEEYAPYMDNRTLSDNLQIDLFSLSNFAQHLIEEVKPPEFYESSDDDIDIWGMTTDNVTYLDTSISN